jgi:DNA-binding transcriptional LysR family regulator
MPRSVKPWDVRVADVMVFLAVRTHGSVTAAARSTGSTPSHVSKALTRLERQLGTRLLVRSGRGVTLTAAALRVLPWLSTAVDSLVKARQGANPVRDVTVAAPSYLLNAFVPSLASTFPALRFRGLQMGPGAIRAQLGLNHFEVALSVGDSTAFPDSWHAEQVGALESGLFASASLAKKLGPVTVDAVSRLPFITPVSFTDSHWEPMDDDCPLPVGERIAGHEAPTIALALAIAAEVDQVVFGPRLAARDAVESGRLVELVVPGWHVTRPTFLAVDIDRITGNELKQVRSVAKAMLDAQGE